MSTAGVGSRLGAAWVRCYTRRLPAEMAEERRDELASDLWEHVADATRAGRSGRTVDLEVIGRVLSGVPADLSWRRGVLRSQQRSDQGARMYLHRFRDVADKALLGLAAVGSAIAFTLVPFLIASAVAGNVGEVVWAGTAAILASLLVVGMVVRDRRPVLATILLVVGAAAPALAWFWLPPTYLLSLAIVVAAVGAHRVDLAAATAAV